MSFLEFEKRDRGLWRENMVPEGGVEPPLSVVTHQILSLAEHQVKSYEKLTKPWGFAGFHQTKRVIC